MNESAHQYLVALAAVPFLGRRTLQKIQAYRAKMKVSWNEVWTRLAQQEVGTPLTSTQRISLQAFQRQWTPQAYSESLHELGIQTLIVGVEHYPALLSQVPDRPIVLFTRGWIPDESALAIAMVGTRHPTGYGEVVTQKIVQELVEGGCAIISGFMYGIDQVAHRAAMQAEGRTVGVLGYGFNQMSHHYHHLRDELLASGGGFITEYPPDHPARPGTFPARNRIIAGLSRAVVVTEAAARSGSLITATQAAEYGREVCAVPGPVTSVYTEGTRALLNEGATLVSSGQDVLQAVGIEARGVIQRKTKERTNTLEQTLLEILQAEALDAEQLATRTKTTLSQVLSALTELELVGYIKTDGENWQLRVY
jgi:DNA processing protein